MKLTSLVLLFWCFLVITSCRTPYEGKSLLVETNYGTIRGIRSLSRYGRPFNSFRGIPFAKPPVGDLRFHAPEILDKWKSILDCTRDRSYCIQKNYLFSNPKVEGEEDCLYLNVYVPQTELEALLPVMIFIHWGAFMAGRGTSDYQGPEFIMDRDVILVTFNYRLAVMGFLTTSDDEAPGNYGMKDQVAALKWVKENIKKFGGDNQKITIFGQSVGGGSSHLHMLSPSSRGLFQQVISQSGNALALWAKPNNLLQQQVTASQAIFVGCGALLGNSSQLIKCLRDVDAAVLVDSGDIFKVFSTEPYTAYSLVTETKSKRNPEPFLTKEPLQYILDEEFLNIPWIIGLVQDEGILKAGPFIRQQTVRENLNANFSLLIPQMMFLELSVGKNQTGELAKQIIDFYLEGTSGLDPDNDRTVQGFIDLYTDRAFSYSLYQSAMLHSAKGHIPIWFYEFNYRGEYTFGDLFATTDEDIKFNWGVSHCDELMYLFKSPALIPELTNKLDLQMSEKLLDRWTSFAIYGDPNHLCKNGTQWKSLNIMNLDQMKNENLQILHISGSHDNIPIQESIQRGFKKDRMKFWSSKSLHENFPGLD